MNLRMTLVLVIVLIVLAGSGWFTPAPASAHPLDPVGMLEPTPISDGEEANTPRQGSPLIGLLILAAPLVFLAWKSRGKKTPNITSASCLPVIDESKRPFKPGDE